MVTELQFAAIGAFLLWCLASSLCGVLRPEQAGGAKLVWREHGPDGWSGWREVHFGLTAADRRVLDHADGTFNRDACDGLFDTVLHQALDSDSDAVQFAIVHMSADGADAATVVFVSDVRDLMGVASR